jgi:hypothetical protein
VKKPELPKLDIAARELPAPYVGQTVLYRTITDDKFVPAIVTAVLGDGKIEMRPIYGYQTMEDPLPETLEWLYTHDPVSGQCTAIRKTQ